MAAQTRSLPKKKCSSFRFSNDRWSTNAVNALSKTLDSQHTSPEASAALVVGSGGLPYLLSHLNTPRVFGIDLSDDVLILTAWRISRLGGVSNWDDYHYDIEAEMASNRTPQRHCYVDEYLTAEQSGLQGDFSRAKKSAGGTEFTFIRGDLEVMAPYIGRLAAREGREFTFVNFTNVANYTGIDRAALQTALSAIPLADDAIIVDSAPNLCPVLYSSEEYHLLGSRV